MKNRHIVNGSFEEFLSGYGGSVVSSRFLQEVNQAMKYPQHLQRIMENLKRLPGVGSRSAERFAFQLIEWKPHQLAEFAALIQEIPERLKPCAECGCLVDNGRCQFCEPHRQSSGLLCVIGLPKEAYAVEETREYRGLYHVLGALLSPLEGKGPDQLNIGRLRDRIQRHSIQEVILALDSTLEGDATSLYLKRELEDLNLKISRLAFGLPMGSSFDYVDGGTLARAFLGRNSF